MSRIMDNTLASGTINNAAWTARNEGPDTKDIPNPQNLPIYDFYLEDGRTGHSVGAHSLEGLAAMGQAMVIKQRPGTGKLAGKS